MEELGLALVHKGAVTQLICSGELTSLTSKAFDEAVTLALESAPQELHVDTRAVEDLSPEGVVALLGALHRCFEVRVRWRLIAGPIVEDALDVAGLGWLVDAVQDGSVEEGAAPLMWMTQFPAVGSQNESGK